MNKYFTIISFLLFSFHIANSSVLTQYSGLEDDYWKWKETFAPPKTVLGRLFGGFGYFQASPPPPEPSTQHDELQKKLQCQAFIESNNYVYAKADAGKLVKKGESKKTYLKSSTDFSLDDEIRDVKSSTDFSSDDEIRDVMIGSQKDSLKMFRCATDEGDKHTFHLTFALKKDYAFVVTSRKNTKESTSMKNIVFQALLQPDAVVDRDALKRKSELRATFWKNVKEAIARLHDPNLKNLCFLSDRQHFNICSVVADKLYREPSFSHFQSDRSLNYVYEMQERCTLMEISDGAEDALEEDVMPCAINDETGSKPQFYLLRHVTSENLPASVYVLIEGEDRKLGLYTRVDNVLAMTMP